MTRMTVRDVRLHWPKAEKALAEGEEIVVTRDSKPVARILPFIPPPAKARPRFDPVAHMRRLRRLWKGRSFGPSTDEWLARDRADD
jgi:antitoxin (DNA-binding transcriptional repressor) of toxin-antitoxin stability system